ncbi:MAG: SpvB/TcaC N-terminal domain-containing protein, partial [bacterium]
IELPMGTAGLSPSLSLTYSSMNGNGPFGLGWDISISKISRSYLYGVPTYGFDDENGFIDIITFNGTHLVFNKKSQGDLYYRLEKDSGYTDLIYTQKPIKIFDQQYEGGWKVQYADGKTDYFVNHPCFVESDLITEGKSCSEATISDDTKISSWLLAASSDTNGNLISYFYTYNKGEIVIDKIQYGGKNGDVVTIKFYILDDERPDPTFDYRAGFKRQNVNLYSKIHVYLKDTLIKKYCFIYRLGFNSGDNSKLLYDPDCTPKDDTLTTQPASNDPDNKALHIISYLDRILSISEDKPYNESTLHHPEIVFRYSSWFTSDILGTKKKLVYPVRGFNGRLKAGSGYFNELLDVNADGLPDIISNRTSAGKLDVLENPGQLGRDVDVDFQEISSLTFR